MHPGTSESVSSWTVHGRCFFFKDLRMFHEYNALFLIINELEDLQINDDDDDDNFISVSKLMAEHMCSTNRGHIKLHYLTKLLKYFKSKKG